jgi:hypothetical protein
MRSKISEKGSKGLRKGRFSQKEALLYQGWEAFPPESLHSKKYKKSWVGCPMSDNPTLFCTPKNTQKFKFFKRLNFFS